MECPFLLPLFFKVTLSPNFNSFLDRRIQEKEQKERMPRDFFSPVVVTGGCSRRAFSRHNAAVVGICSARFLLCSHRYALLRRNFSSGVLQYVVVNFEATGEA